MKPELLPFKNQIQEVVDFLRHSSNVLVITGAGMSADSGLPTYRGIGGLYEDIPTEDGLPIEQALSGPVFRQNPEITWKYLGQIEQGCRQAAFNRGHQVLAELESRFERFWILTQNIDGFHTAAGSRNVIEIHGNLHHLNCTACNYRQQVDDFSTIQIPPACPECGAMVRPSVVLFEEQLPEQAIETFYREVQQGFDLVISIGTSSYFPYIIQPVVYAHQQGDRTVEINPVQTPVSEIVDIKLPVFAAAALDEISQQLSQIETQP